MTKWWEWFRSLFGRPSREPELEIRLDASSEEVLSTSLRRLLPGQIGWITIDEARRLFSSADNATALGMFDPDGTLALANFAAAAQHRSGPTGLMAAYNSDVYRADVNAHAAWPNEIARALISMTARRSLVASKVRLPAKTPHAMRARKGLDWAIWVTSVRMRREDRPVFRHWLAALL